MSVVILAVTAAVTILPPPARAADVTAPRGPTCIRFEPDRGTLLVVCEKSGTVARLHPETGVIEREVEVGQSPVALASSARERLYVACRRSQEIVELDASSLEVTRRMHVSGDPDGVAVSGDGRRLYASLHALDQVAVIDLETGDDVRRLAAGNGPGALERSPCQPHVYVMNLLPSSVRPGEPCRVEITVIDDITGRVVERTIIHNANVGRDIAFTPDGTLAIATITRPKNLIPMTQVARGWVVTNGFVVLAPGTTTPPVQLLVDQPNRFYADPHALVVTPDGGKLYMTSAGSDLVLAIDLPAVRRTVEEAASGRIPRHADHLGLSRRYVTARIPVGANPQSLATRPDGRLVYVANRLDDSISVIETATDEVVRTLAIGYPAPPDRVREGERLFHSAARTFQSQFSCASCHPDSGFDGLQYDLEPDGIGQNILDNRNLRAVADTAPFKWVGSNPDITTQCGTRTAKWIVRTGWLTTMEVVALAEYIRSIPPTVNPYLAPDGRLTAAQRRGKAFFERTTTNDGEVIPVRDRCHVCHSGPKFTNRRRFDVGTRGDQDTAAEFDVAHLNNIFESAPYLHDGRAATLEEIWTIHNPDDTHGISSDWTKQQLNDLIEYLKVIRFTGQSP